VEILSGVPQGLVLGPIINLWNSLPEFVVTANTIDCFKTRLHKFWNSQDVKFDCKQNLTGLHNRSMIT